MALLHWIGGYGGGDVFTWEISNNNVFSVVFDVFGFVFGTAEPIRRGHESRILQRYLNGADLVRYTCATSSGSFVTEDTDQPTFGWKTWRRRIIGVSCT